MFLEKRTREHTSQPNLIKNWKTYNKVIFIHWKWWYIFELFDNLYITYFVFIHIIIKIGTCAFWFYISNVLFDVNKPSTIIYIIISIFPMYSLLSISLKNSLKDRYFITFNKSTKRSQVKVLKKLKSIRHFLYPYILGINSRY